MLQERPQQNGFSDKAFRSIFERSRIPMTLVDSERRYVAINDATVDFYGFPREEIIGSQTGHTLDAAERPASDAAWEKLVSTGELYDERVVLRADGRRIRVQYAAHASTASGRWLAFIVVLSARVEPGGAELIASATANGDRPPASAPVHVLTPREREVVRRVALGASSPEVAADLYLSPATVRSHVRNAMNKTNARTRAQLVAIALAEGLIDE